MVNQMISLIFMTLSGTVQGIGMEYMMKEKKNGNAVWHVLHWTIFAFIASAINIFVSAGKDTVGLRMSLHWIGAFSAVFLYYKDPFWRRVLAIFLLFFSTGVAELTTVSVLTFTNINMEVMYNRANPVSTTVIAWGTIVSSVYVIIIVLLWKKLFHKGKSMQYFWIVLLSAVNNCITCYLFVDAIWADNMQVYKYVPFIIGTLCQITLLFLVFSQVEKEQMEKNLAYFRKENELEQTYYKDIKKKRDEIADISKRNKEDICRIKTFMGADNFNEAKQVLEEILKRMEQTRGYTYCEIPVVNAVLSEKQKECEQENIKLAVDIILPDVIRIQQFDICSVLGNLLDNAIRACKKVKHAGAKEVQIDMNVAVKGSYIIIKCKNPSMMEQTNKPEGTGYGLKIIKDIAKRYEGDIRIENRESEFEVIVVLKND